MPKHHFNSTSVEDTKELDEGRDKLASRRNWEALQQEPLELRNRSFIGTYDLVSKCKKEVAKKDTGGLWNIDNHLSPSSPERHCSTPEICEHLSRCKEKSKQEQISEVKSNSNNETNNEKQEEESKAEGTQAQEMINITISSTPPESSST